MAALADESPRAQECAGFPAQPAGLGEVDAVLARFWAAVDRALPRPPGVPWRLEFTTAVAEIASNIVRHAHPAGTPPGRVRLRLCAYPGRIRARFTDHGLPFTPPSGREVYQAPDEGDDPTLLPEGGYGLALARAALDELDYSRSADGANRWLLVKRL